MAASLLAQVDELANWIGEPITEERDTKRAELCLRIASALVRTETGKTWDKDNIPEAAVMVTLYCASRVYENREAENSTGIDDWRASREVDRKSTRLNSSHVSISYAVFCLK